MAPRKHTLYWKSLAGMKYSRIFLDEPDKTVRRPAVDWEKAPGGNTLRWWSALNLKIKRTYSAWITCLFYWGKRLHKNLPKYVRFFCNKLLFLQSRWFIERNARSTGLIFFYLNKHIVHSGDLSHFVSQSLPNEILPWTSIIRAFCCTLWTPSLSRFLQRQVFFCSVSVQRCQGLHGSWIIFQDTQQTIKSSELPEINIFTYRARH